MVACPPQSLGYGAYSTQFELPLNFGTNFPSKRLIKNTPCSTTAEQRWCCWAMRTTAHQMKHTHVQKPKSCDSAALPPKDQEPLYCWPTWAAGGAEPETYGRMCRPAWWPRGESGNHANTPPPLHPSPPAAHTTCSPETIDWLINTWPILQELRIYNLPFETTLTWSPWSPW